MLSKGQTTVEYTIIGLVIISIIISGVSLAVVSGISVPKNTATSQDINQTANRLKGKISSLEDKISTLKARISSLEKKVPGKAPAKLIVSDINAPPANTGEKKTISVTVMNIGDKEGAKDITLKVAGKEVGTQRVTVPAGGRKTISFTARRKEAGDYQVKAGKLTATWSVTGKPTKKVTLNYWTIDHEPKRMKIQKELADEFEKEHPNVDVKITPVTEDKLPSMFMSAKAAGGLPDVVLASPTLATSWAEKGITNTEIVDEVVEEVGDFYEGAMSLVLNPAAKGGKYSMVPTGGWVQCVFYRKDLFKDRGLEKPNTTDKILAAAKEFHNPDEDMWGIGIAVGPERTMTSQSFDQIALSFGARIWNAKGNVVADSTEMAKALDYYAKLAKYGLPGKDIYWKQIRSYYTAGKIPMAIYSTYLIGDVAEVEGLPKNTGVVTKIKGPKQTAGYGTIQGFVFPKQNLNRKAAKEWAKFIVTEGYSKWQSMSPPGKVPMRKGGVSGWAKWKKFDPYSKGLPRRIANGLSKAKRMEALGGKVFAEFGEVRGKYLEQKAIWDVIKGAKSPSEAASWLATRVKEIKAE